MRRTDHSASHCVVTYLHDDSVIRCRKDAISLKSTLVIFNTFCFSTATVIKRTHLSVTVHGCASLVVFIVTAGM